MSSYVNELPAHQTALNQINKDISFGMSVVAQFGAANRLAGLTTAQVVQVAQQLAPIQSLLRPEAAIQLKLAVMACLVAPLPFILETRLAPLT